MSSFDRSLVALDAALHTKDAAGASVHSPDDVLHFLAYVVLASGLPEGAETPPAVVAYIGAINASLGLEQAPPNDVALALQRFFATYPVVDALLTPFIALMRAAADEAETFQQGAAAQKAAAAVVGAATSMLPAERGPTPPGAVKSGPLARAVANDLPLKK